MPRPSGSENKSNRGPTPAFPASFQSSEKYSWPWTALAKEKPGKLGELLLRP